MKATVISILVSVSLIAVAIIISGRDSELKDVIGVNNVSIIDGKQIIEIRAKGGYLPRKTVALAGMPTVLRFNTSGTFDCSSSVRIPSMGISKYLPPSGTSDIDLGESKVGTTQGTCGMGMYPFEIDFQIMKNALKNRQGSTLTDNVFQP